MAVEHTKTVEAGYDAIAAAFAEWSTAVDGDPAEPKPSRASPV